MNAPGPSASYRPMGIDAVALLRLPNLASPSGPLGTEHLVQHRGDASLVHLFLRFDATAPDEHALALREILGLALDAHDDPRGILFFPDVCEPAGASYDAIVRALGGAGVWTPKVDADHVPARYAAAQPGSHEALVARMIERMGRDEAREVDAGAHVNQLVIDATNGREDAVAGYRAMRARIAALMGDPFAADYEASLRRTIDADRAATEARRAKTDAMFARMKRGEPAVSEAEMSAFLGSGGTAVVLAALDPSIRSALRDELAGIDVSTLPEHDLARHFASALHDWEDEDAAPSSSS